jgi:hypothetical protein
MITGSSTQGPVAAHMYRVHPAGECDEIVKLASPRLARSVVVDNAKSDATRTTKLNPSSIRTSHGMFFARGENEVVQGEGSGGQG